MKNYSKGIKLIQNRKKMVGKTLGVLFGTVTEDDLKFIRKESGCGRKGRGDERNAIDIECEMVIAVEE